MELLSILLSHHRAFGVDNAIVFGSKCSVVIVQFQLLHNWHLLHNFNAQFQLLHNLHIT